MSILYLHIGGPKTGSTFLQSVFRTNRSTLLEMGIHYPTGNEYPDSPPTSWTSGNGGGILESPKAFAKALEEIRHYPGSSLLYSYEGLRNDVCMAEKVSFMPAIARTFGFTQIKVLFFVRNPVTYMVSVWQQYIKYNGNHETLEEKILSPDTMLMSYQMARHVLENLSNNEPFHLTALNYSNCADRLIDVTAEWLGVPADRLSIPDALLINRSLTRAELTLQMAMNRVLGSDANFLARTLTETLTDIRPEKIIPSLMAQQTLWDRVAPLVQQANHHLPPGHEIIFDRQEPEPIGSDQFTFSAAQLELIGKVLAEEIRNQRHPYIPTPITAPPTPPSVISRAWRKLRAIILK